MIWWVRHGQSTWNALDRLQGHELGPPLTDLGRDQASRAAAELATRGATTLCASPAVRAQQTAEVIAGVLGLPIETDELLLEKGLDESVGDVVVRVRTFLERADSGTTVAVSHGDTIGLAIGLLAGQAPSAPANASILGVDDLGTILHWQPSSA